MDLSSDQTQFPGLPTGLEAGHKPPLLRRQSQQMLCVSIPHCSLFKVTGDVSWAIQLPLFKLCKHLLPCFMEFDRTSGLIYTLQRRMCPPLRCVIQTVTAFEINWAGPCFFIFLQCPSDISCQFASGSLPPMARSVFTRLDVCMMCLKLQQGS